MNIRKWYNLQKPKSTIHGLIALLLLVSILGSPVGRPTAVVATGPYVVNVVTDGPDSNHFDGTCYDGVAGCTLRAALDQAGHDGGTTTITFSSSIAGSTIDLISYGPILWDGSNITVDGGSNNITISG